MSIAKEILNQLGGNKFIAMKKENVKIVKITIPNTSVLNLVTTTPSFQRLTKLKLVLGENIEKVNHFQFLNKCECFQ
jgi:hypothetical protein